MLVSYESSTHGRAALSHALRLARQARVPLTVVSVARQEPVNVGCARCRQSAAIWNREMRLLADEQLAEAAGLVGADPAVEYKLAVGRAAQALADLAARSGADVLVLPCGPTGRIRGLFSSSVARELRKPGRWKVILAPAATARSGDGSRVTSRRTRWERA